MEDYKTRKDRMTRKGRAFIRVEASVKLLRAVTRTCKNISRSQGIRYTLTRAIHDALTDWLNKH